MKQNQSYDLANYKDKAIHKQLYWDKIAANICYYTKYLHKSYL